MPELLPWDGRDLFSNGPGTPREELLRQRITRAFEKAGEDGVDLMALGQWGVEVLAQRLMEKLDEFFVIANKENDDAATM